MKKTRMMDVASIIVSQLCMGFAGGYVAYMRGIQKGDPFVIVGWFVILPLLAILSELNRQIPRQQPSFRSIALFLVSPLFLLLGFSGAYSYPVWNCGWLFALLAGVLSTAMMFAVTIVFRNAPHTPVFLTMVSRFLVPACCVVAAIAVVATPLQFENLNVLDYAGQGILNSKSDDNHFKVLSAGVWKTGVFDGYEAPGSDPNVAKQIGNLDVRRRPWLDGPVLALIGKGYSFGDSRPGTEKSGHSPTTESPDLNP